MNQEAFHVAAVGRRGRGEASCVLRDFKGKAHHSFRVSGELLAQHLRLFGGGDVSVVAANNVLVRRDNVATVLATMEDAP